MGKNKSPHHIDNIFSCNTMSDLTKEIKKLIKKYEKQEREGLIKDFQVISVCISNTEVASRIMLGTEYRWHGSLITKWVKNE